LVSAIHLGGLRGEPVTTAQTIGSFGYGAHLPGGLDDPGAFTVLLGPTSELGRALLAHRDDLARAVLAQWYAVLPLGAVAVEVVCHSGPDDTPASLSHAARMLAFARQAGIPAVLTAAVRYATADGAVTADILDAARRLVPLGTRHLDRTTAAGYLAGAEEMHAVADRIARAAGFDGQQARQLLVETEQIADRCRLDAAADLGIGQVHLPEPTVVTGGQAASHDEADAVLRRRCEAGVGRRYPGAGEAMLRRVHRRLDDELATITGLGYPTYFLTVAEVCDLIRARGVRVAARGSGAGSLVNHLLGISGVEPLGLGLLMERFCTPLRAELPDIDIDVESARRTEIYEWILARFGGERVSCVSMMDTYRVRHAVRDVGAALGLPPSEIDAIATAFPHISARNVRDALADLPELARTGLAGERYALLFDLVERLDALPRHIALHPCGVLLSNASLLDRTPMEASWQGFPMSQFDKDDVEVLGLLKLDVLGIRMQSAMAHALSEIVRVDGADAVRAGRHPDGAAYLDAESGLIDLDAVPLDDEDTFRLVRSTRTLGCFQIESPGQRELVGKYAPQEFADLVIDISLFRPGPVKSDMIQPFLRARQGWSPSEYLHPTLIPALAETCGVVVFHEQVIKIVATVAGVSLDKGDEIRRRMGSTDGQHQIEPWLRERAAVRGYHPHDVDRIWAVLKAFASFGFCKAHAAAFALPTYQSAWLKAHHPAAFLAGVLTHDPGMYPKRLILDDARNLGITVLGLDVNASSSSYRVERLTGAGEGACSSAAVGDTDVVVGDTDVVVGDTDVVVGVTDMVDAGVGGSVISGASCEYSVPVTTDCSAGEMRYDAWVPDASAYGIRLALTDVKGITEAEVARIVAGQPYESLSDFWYRAAPSRPIAERLVLAGGLDSLYGLDRVLPVSRRGKITHRDLLLQVADLDRWSRGLGRGSPRRNKPTAVVVGEGASVQGDDVVHLDPRAAAARQSQAAAAALSADRLVVQTAIDLGEAPEQAVPSGLPELTPAERVRAELEILGLDASAHIVRFYLPMLRDLAVVPARAMLGRRSRSEVLVAGVKVATQTPPIRSGRRVVFLTLDDSTGPVDATFFEDVQGPYAATVFGCWLLLVRGVLRRTGPRGISLRATGAWELPVMWDAWCDGGSQAVFALMEPVDSVINGGLAAVGRPGAQGAFVRDEGPARIYGIERDDGTVNGPTDGQGPEAERAAAAALRHLIAARAGDPPPATRRPGEPAPVFVEPQPFEPAPHEPAASERVGYDQTVDRPHASGDDTAPNRTTATPAKPGSTGGGRRVLVHASGYRQSPYADIRPAGIDPRTTRAQVGHFDEAVIAERRRRAAPPRTLWHASPGSSGR
jgi:error-prone DNA polymerase